MKYAFILIPILLISCSKEIGDNCGYDMDCSVNMDRICDNGQPSGYCLILSCEPNSCPSESTCIEFTTPLPINHEQMTLTDAGLEDLKLYEQIEPNRVRTYCLRHCEKNSDCRSNYSCSPVYEMDAKTIDYENNHTNVCVPKVK